jgi:hypothetical protein
MSGYVFVLGPCFGCDRLFTYNPHKVPSINHEGTRYPVCRDCVERSNPLRVKKGLPRIVPLPDAYEALPEEEL